MSHVPSSAPHEVDCHWYAFQFEPITQLVLDPVAVVARHETRIVHEKAEARRPLVDLRAVQKIESPPVPRGPFPFVAELAEEAVQLCRGYAGRVLRVLLLDLVEQPLHAAAGLRRDGDQRWALSKARLEARAYVLDADDADVPLREDDDRRAHRLARDVGDCEILVDDALRNVDQHERDVRALRGLERAQLRVVLDPLTLPALAAHAGRVDEHERGVAALQYGV